MSQGDAPATKTSAADCNTVAREVAGTRGIPQVDSDSLFQGARELVITHRGERYSLRVTRNEKLILTK